MRRHFFYCNHCKEVVQSVEHLGAKYCPKCEVEQAIAKPNKGVVQDTLKYGMRLDSLKGRPYVESVSDIKRAMKRNDERYGTKLHMA